MFQSYKLYGIHLDNHRLLLQIHLVGYSLYSKCFFRCLHSVLSSLREFSDAICGLQIITGIYFSFKHKLQSFVDGEYALPLSPIFHLMVLSVLLSLRVHM